MACDCKPNSARVCDECEIRALQTKLQQAQEENQYLVEAAQVLGELLAEALRAEHRSPQCGQEQSGQEPE